MQIYNPKGKRIGDLLRNEFRIYNKKDPFFKCLDAYKPRFFSIPVRWRKTKMYPLEDIIKYLKKNGYTFK